MTPEEIDAINNLNQTIASLGMNASVQNELLKKMAQQQGINVKNINDNLNDFGKNVQSASGATKSLKTAEENYEKALKNLQDATASTVVGFKSLTTAILESERSFGKYNGALKSFGDAALSLGKALGPLGTVIGGVVKGFTMVGEAALKQADNTLKAYDNLSKFGGAGAMTTKQLLEMGHASGLTSKNLQTFVEAAKKANTGLAGLGLTAGDGMKTFGRLTAISSEQREAFQKLGVSQEELMANQGEYVKLQQISGRSLLSMTKDMDKLKKQSLEYTENLLTLANLTGKDIAQIKADQQAALSRRETLIQTSMMEQEINRLRATGNEQDKKRADQIEKELAARNDLLGALKTFEYDEAMQDGIAKFLATGAIDENSALLKRMGVPIEEFAARIKKGENVTGDFINALNSSIDTQVREKGTALALSEANQKAFVGGSKNLQAAAAARGKDINEALAEARKQIGKPKEGKPGETAATDPALEARAKLTTAEIKATVALDELLASVNPLINGFNALSTAFTVLAGAAAAAGAALAGIAGYNALKSAGGMFGGKSGPTVTGPAGTAGKGQYAAAPGMIEKLGGSGNLLGGFANGLKAFANPQVALGAAGFAAAIAAIGAGLAGASWLLGKTLPTLAEGFGAFEKLDGEKLLAAGKGIGGLGAGLAVFGAGGALAGFGAIAANLSEGINEFFGGKTPFQRVEEFSKLDIDPDRTKKNAEAYIAFGKAMASSGLGSAVSGLGNLVGGLADSVGKLFGNKDAVQKFVDFTKLDVDPTKAEKLAEAFSKYANAMVAVGGVKPATPSSAVGSSAAPAGGSGGRGASPAGPGGSREPTSPGAQGKPGGDATATAAPTTTSEKDIKKVIEFGPGFNKVETAGGEVQIRQGVRNWRNNNPGNIINSSFAKKYGAVGGDDRFAIFPSLEAGKKAKEDLLFGSSSKYIDLSISNAINRYAPPHENNTAAYINSVTKALGGVSPDTLLKSLDGGQRSTFLDAISKVEGFKEGKILKARDGGEFNGPDSGYLVELHGREIAAPTEKFKQILSNLAQVSKKDLDATDIGKTMGLQTANKTTTSSDNSAVEMLSSMFGNLEGKFDELIDAVNQGNNTQSKILKYSRA